MKWDPLLDTIAELDALIDPTHTSRDRTENVGRNGADITAGRDLADVAHPPALIPAVTS